ncbi:hypothetical protein PM082_015742 [Marasmius tenuissimus]|nr:hypothetical protein PM082_015742 [Marasmius tenuissimus]
MLTALYKGSGVFRNWIRPDQKNCPSGDDKTISLFDAGSTMQALSAFALASKNSTFVDILRAMAQSSNLQKDWNSPGGILDTELARPSTKGSDAEVTDATQGLLRSYYDLVVSDDTASDLRTFVRAYLEVQYTALANRAPLASNAQNLYGKGLLPGNQLNPDYQLLAITTLLGGVISGDNVTSSAPGGGNDSGDPTTGTSGSRVPVGAIVGGVVGGIVGLLLIAAGIYYYMRRRRQSQSSPTPEPYPAATSEVASFSSPVVSTSNCLPFRSGKYERQASVVPVSPGITDITTSASITNPSESRSSRIHEATTAELVTILNQRLRNERWDANESPPEYRGSVV